jgi:hypothetical protein
VADESSRNACDLLARETRQNLRSVRAAVWRRIALNATLASSLGCTVLDATLAHFLVSTVFLSRR